MAFFFSQQGSHFALGYSKGYGQSNDLCERIVSLMDFDGYPGA